MTKPIDTVIAEIVKERMDFLTRSALRDFVDMPVSKLIRHCAATRLAQAIKEDDVLERLNAARSAYFREELSREDLERTVRGIQSELGTATLLTPRHDPKR